MNPVVINERQQAFDGKVYGRRRNGYYQSNATLLHRAVWEHHNGPIVGEKREWHVHHIDHDRGNNAIENLELRRAGEHNSAHNSTPERRAASRQNMLDRVIPAARAWHSSAKGRKWHRKHALEVAAAMKDRPGIPKECIVCGASFEARRPSAEVCGPNCRAKRGRERRKAGVPVNPNRQTVLRIAPRVVTCCDCGAGFETKSGRVKRCEGCRAVYETERNHAAYLERKAALEAYRKGAREAG